MPRLKPQQQSKTLINRTLSINVFCEESRVLKPSYTVAGVLCSYLHMQQRGEHQDDLYACFTLTKDLLTKFCCTFASFEFIAEIAAW